jgi:hypothetical protein
MVNYAPTVREHIDLSQRVAIERLMGSNLELALFDVAFSTNTLSPTLVRSYQDSFPGQQDGQLIDVLAEMLPRLNRYQQTADDAKNLGLYPTGVLLTRLRLVQDACGMLQNCLLYAYLSLVDQVTADRLWAASDDTRGYTYGELLAKGLGIIDEAQATSQLVVDHERARQARDN